MANGSFRLSPEIIVQFFFSVTTLHRWRKSQKSILRHPLMILIIFIFIFLALDDFQEEKNRKLQIRVGIIEIMLLSVNELSKFNIKKKRKKKFSSLCDPVRPTDGSFVMMDDCQNWSIISSIRNTLCIRVSCILRPPHITTWICIKIHCSMEFYVLTININWKLLITFRIKYDFVPSKLKKSHKKLRKNANAIEFNSKTFSK